MNSPFLLPTDSTFLDTAGYGLPPHSCVAALREALGSWESGRASWQEDWEPAGERCRQLFAQIIHGEEDEVALMPTVSLASAIVASAVPTDGEVLVASGEFRSVLYPFLVAETRRLLRVREVSPDGLLNALSDRTALVALSHIRSADGHVADLDAIVGCAHAAGAFVYIDATHSVGTLPFDVKRSGVDFLSCAAYKWLCCPRGVAFLWCRRELQQRMSPLAAGWRAAVDHRVGGYYGSPLDLGDGAARFDVSLAWHAWVGAAESLKAITMIDEQERFRRGYQLARALAKDLELPEPRSAIVSVPVTSRESAHARLKQARVKVTEQRDRVRVSPHFYNTQKDIERAVTALSTLVAR